MKCILSFLIISVIFGCSFNKQDIPSKSNQSFSLSQNNSNSKLIDLGNLYDSLSQRAFKGELDLAKFEETCV